MEAGKFDLGDIVTWYSHARRKNGQIVAVLKAGNCPLITIPSFLKGYRIQFPKRYIVRPEESYLVEVANLELVRHGKNFLYWPDQHGLELVSRPERLWHGTGAQDSFVAIPSVQG